MLPRGFLKNLDIVLLACVLLLTGGGLFFLYTIGDGTGPGGYFFTRQMIWLGLALAAGVLCFTLNYKLWERFSWLLYLINIGLLALLLVIGERTKGAESWFDLGIFRVQPSEFAKILFIVTFAGHLSKYRHNINRFTSLLLCLGQFLLPFGLILMQPDMGTGLVFMAIFFGMMYVSGVDGLTLFVTITSFVSAGIAAAPFVVKEYQFKRLTAFLNPEADPRGAGYQLIQSKIAIGSGGLWGKGFFGGEQASLGFLPTSQSDFIFAAICEQAGFVGGLAVIAVFMTALFRIMRISGLVEDLFANYIAAGIFCMLAFQGAVNIGMTLGLFPITGIPLPFVSYGGSSLLMNGIAIGLLLNISVRRRKIMFV